MKRKYSDWFVELGALGALGPDEQAEFNLCRRQDPDLEKRISALQQSSRDILDRYPWPLAPSRSPAVAARPSPSRVRFRPKLELAGLAVLGLFGIGLMTVSILSHRGDRSLALAMREKGEETAASAYGLRIYRRGSGGVERLRDGETVGRGDWLQIACRLPNAEHAYILSLDGAGRATCHWSAERDPSEKPAGGDWFNLPDGLILDEAPAYERFFLLTADRPVAADRVVQAMESWACTSARAGDDIPVLPGLTVRAAVNLRKTQ